MVIMGCVLSESTCMGTGEGGGGRGEGGGGRGEGGRGEGGGGSLQTPYALVLHSHYRYNHH